MSTIQAAMAGLALMVSAQAAYGSEGGIFGKYSRKVGGDVVKVGVYPLDSNVGGTHRVQLFFTFDAPRGERIRFDGVGHIRGNQVVLYNRTYHLVVTVNKERADLSLEQSCGNHRLYPGYGHYSEHCDPEVARLEPLAKGLRKEAQ